jgi:hypothetical protein
MKRPIAMRCTQEQFDGIKDRINLPIIRITSFCNDPYLTNITKEGYNVSNISYNLFNQDIHETFNADIFLEACGVEVEKVEYQIFLCGNWCDTSHQIRIKPQPNYDKEIKALQQKAKENGMKVIINFEKL